MAEKIKLAMWQSHFHPASGRLKSGCACGTARLRATPETAHTKTMPHQTAKACFGTVGATRKARRPAAVWSLALSAASKKPRVCWSSASCAWATDCAADLVLDSLSATIFHADNCQARRPHHRGNILQSTLEPK